MKKYYTNEECKQAKNVSLFDYICDQKMNEHSLRYKELRRCDNHSVTICRKGNFYHDFATGEGGDNIKYLQEFYGMTFQEAVGELLDFAGIRGIEVITTYQSREEADEEEEVEKEVIIPERLNNKFSILYGYLNKARKIDIDVINDVVKEGLLYQSKNFNNMIFINKPQNYLEIKGTNLNKNFKRTQKTRKTNYWWMGPMKGLKKTVYICESALDALSLYNLHKRMGIVSGKVYCSIGGVANHGAIKRICREFEKCEIVMAVDTDKAGDIVCKKFSHLRRIKPVYKDWNEDLQKGVQTAEE